MRKILLTSSGFDNIKIGKKALELIGKKSNLIKVLFIPTAAITESQKKIIPLCIDEIKNLGICSTNIELYNFEMPLDSKMVIDYDVIYVAGGNTRFLLEKMRSGYLPINLFLDNGGLYIGVSAGSIVMTTLNGDGLGFLDCNLEVHQEIGTDNGPLQSDDRKTIKLTDNQAVLINDNEVNIFS
jgi:dipeptidase E